MKDFSPPCLLSDKIYIVEALKALTDLAGHNQPLFFPFTSSSGPGAPFQPSPGHQPTSGPVARQGCGGAGDQPCCSTAGAGTDGPGGLKWSGRGQLKASKSYECARGLDMYISGLGGQEHVHMTLMW